MTTIGLHALARSIRCPVLSPSDLVRQIQRYELERNFRDLVRRFTPAQSQAILTAGAGKPRERAESERLFAFQQAFAEQYFPIMEFEELEYLLYGPPFQRMGWDYDDMHEPDHFRPEFQMLLVLIASPYEDEYHTAAEAGFASHDYVSGTRVVIQESLEPVLGRSILATLGPPLEPDVLHLRLDVGPFKPLAEFADWVWGRTDTIFLDASQDMEVGDADWTDDTIDELTRQWHIAEGILQRIDELGNWLSLDPKKHFSLLAAAAATPHPSESDPHPGCPCAQCTPGPRGRPLIDIFSEDDIAHASDSSNDSPAPSSHPADQRDRLPAGAAV